MKRNLILSTYGAALAKETRHAQTVMKDLGITYEESTPQSCFDCWQFWNCENVPEQLPDFIEDMKYGPMKYIGLGLSEETAKRLEENSK